jgi:hypothetical protein
MSENAGRRRSLMRCPTCGGTGEPFSRVETQCPECHGSGELDTIWRWLRAWWFVAGHVGGLLFLLVAGWFLCAFPAMLALSALLSAFGIEGTWGLRAFRWLTILFAAGALGFAWCYVRGHGARRTWG